MPLPHLFALGGEVVIKVDLEQGSLTAENGGAEQVFCLYS